MDLNKPNLTGIDELGQGTSLPEFDIKVFFLPREQEIVLVGVVPDRVLLHKLVDPPLALFFDILLPFLVR